MNGTPGRARTGIMTLAGLLAVFAALIVLAGITVVLWWAGDARIPIVVLVFGMAALGWCGFLVGRATRPALLRSAPQGPEQIAWQPSSGRVRAGLVREHPAGAAAVGSTAVGVLEPSGEGDRPVPGGDGP